MKAYLDTSAIGGLFDDEPVGRKEIAEALIRSVQTGNIEMVISDLVLEEVDRGPSHIRGGIIKILQELEYEILDESKESTELALRYLEKGVLPESSRDDSRHIAIASTNGIGVIVSWNFKHMANVKVVHAVNAINLQLGYRSIEIVPPEEVLDYGEMGI